MGSKVKTPLVNNLSELFHGEEYSKATHQKKNSRNDIPLN